MANPQSGHLTTVSETFTLPHSGQLTSAIPIPPLVANNIYKISILLYHNQWI